MRASEAQGIGCALFDYDDDGWQDVLLVARPHPLLYHNSGGGQFTDVTEMSGVMSADGQWVGCAIGDYDGDGRQDLLLTGLHCLALLRNCGVDGFKLATAEAGLDPGNNGHWATSAGFMDLDGDGWQDLVLLNFIVWGPGIKEFCELTPGITSSCPPNQYTPEISELWRNNGRGGFELVPAENGMKSTMGIALVVAFTDLNNDGRMDFYIGNDGLFADMMLNLGDMRVENIGHLSGLAARGADAMSAMGADWGDFDRDGRLDLAVTNFQDACYAIFRNVGDNTFRESSAALGVAQATRHRLGWGAKWLDMDQDGWPDISFVNGHVYEEIEHMKPSGIFRQPIQLMRNQLGKEFVDVVPQLDASVGRPLLARGSASGDIDNDGRIDLLVVDFEGPAMLLHNETETKNHWITLDLRSRNPNSLALGARVTARSGDRVWIAEVSPASSYLSASDPRIHWGLGSTDKLESLTIRWPTGKTEVLHDVPVDRIMRINQGDAPLPEEEE